MDVLVLTIHKMAMFEVVTYFKGPQLLKAPTECCNKKNSECYIP